MFSSRHINVAIFSLSDLKNTALFNVLSPPPSSTPLTREAEWGGLSQTKQGHCKPTYKLPVC